MSHHHHTALTAEKPLNTSGLSVPNRLPGINVVRDFFTGVRDFTWWAFSERWSER